MTEKVWREIGKLQAEILVLTLLKSKQPFAYTGSSINEMSRDLQRNSRLENCLQRAKEITKGLSKEDIIELAKQFKDIKFSYEDQRILLKEIIGKSITLEEFLEDYR